MTFSEINRRGLEVVLSTIHGNYARPKSFLGEILATNFLGLLPAAAVAVIYMAFNGGNPDSAWAIGVGAPIVSISLMFIPELFDKG